MQQSSATHSLHHSFGGLRKIVACSPPRSAFLYLHTSLHPTSFLITCNWAMVHKKGPKVSLWLKGLFAISNSEEM